MIIDCYAHICPQKYIDALAKMGVKWEQLDGMATPLGGPVLTNVDKRLEMMAKFKDYAQVLVPAGEVVEPFFDPDETIFLAQTFNDAVAEIVKKHPDKFVGGVATLPLNNIAAALKEIDRAINVLGLKGIYLHTPVYATRERRALELGYDYDNALALDHPDFMPIYEKMAKYDLPIWIHPVGMRGTPVFSGEARGKYAMPILLGWPFESAMGMARIACSGVMAKYPNLKFITHNCGSGAVPMLSGRIGNALDGMLKIGQVSIPVGEGKRPLDYFAMFYADTAIDGNAAGLEMGHAFFTAERMVFGTDAPFDFTGGAKFTKEAIDAVKKMKVSDADKKLIFEGNAKRILHL